MGNRIWNRLLHYEGIVLLMCALFICNGFLFVSLSMELLTGKEILILIATGVFVRTYALKVNKNTDVFPENFLAGVSICIMLIVSDDLPDAWLDSFELLCIFSVYVFGLLVVSLFRVMAGFCDNAQQQVGKSDDR